MHERSLMNAPTTDLGGAYSGRLQGVSAPVPEAPLTLTRAISASENLTQRLVGLRDGVMSVATTIGGPWPVAGMGKPDNAPPASAVGLVNRLVDGQHELVSEIEEAIAAIRRSLGG